MKKQSTLKPINKKKPIRRSAVNNSVQARGRITIKDVAYKAGVGTMTVSRALNNPDLVRDALRKRILAVVEKLGYIPNRVAGRLASGSANTICVVVPTLNHPVYVPFHEALHAVLSAQGFQIMLGTSDYLPENEEKVVASFLGWQPAAMILAGVDHTARTLAMLAQASVVVVEVMDLAKNPVDMNVGFSHQRIGKLVGDFLAVRDYKRIAYVGNRLSRDVRGRRRLSGFQKALQKHKLPKAVVIDKDLPSSIQAGGMLLNELLAQYPKTEVAFFVNDDLAAGALFECQRQGIRVPEDFSIVGFNDTEIAAEVNPGLTSVSTQRFEMGLKVAELLLARVRGQKTFNAQIDLGFRIVERESTRKIRGKNTSNSTRNTNHGIDQNTNHRIARNTKQRRAQ